MKLNYLFIMGIFLVLNACQNEVVDSGEPKKPPFEAINFTTPDSIQIFGKIYERDSSSSTILLFHQGGSNSDGEYRTIIPKLQEMGYNILAIDQRIGGQIYGNYNKTIANIPGNSFDNNYTYCDAYNNLEGALDYAIQAGYSGKRILWGSSYSATLAIQLAHNRPDDVAGVLAFSPASGGSLQNCLANQYFPTLNVPLLILRPPNEMEREAVQMQMDSAAKYNHQVYAAEYGIHGSSMLVEERVGHNVDANWNVVTEFLAGLE